MKRIFILSPHPIFSQGVETLLNRDETLEFIGRETNIDRAIESIKNLQPDVVIFDHESLTCDPGSVIARIMEAKSGIKIVGLNLQSNMLRIYHQEQRTAHEVDDLRRAIRDDDNESELATSAPDLDRKGGTDSRLISV